MFILNGAKRIDADDITAFKIRRISGPRGPVTVGDTFFVRFSLEGKSRAAVDCQVGVSPCLIWSFSHTIQITTLIRAANFGSCSANM